MMGPGLPSWGSHLRQILNRNYRCQEVERGRVEDARGACRGVQSQTQAYSSRYHSLTFRGFHMNIAFGFS